MSRLRELVHHCQRRPGPRYTQPSLNFWAKYTRECGWSYLPTSPSETALNVLSNDRPAPHPRLNGHLLLQTQFLPRRLLPLALGDGAFVFADEVQQNVRHVVGDDRPRVQGVLARPLGPFQGGQHSAWMLAYEFPTEIQGHSLSLPVLFLARNNRFTSASNARTSPIRWSSHLLHIWQSLVLGLHWACLYHIVGYRILASRWDNASAISAAFRAVVRILI